ncbi:MAG: pilin [Candidatus Spechtbacterales bacterium]|nr:pilin [Candidatus Spechtbacterales bacterium]
MKNSTSKNSYIHKVLFLVLFAALISIPLPSEAQLNIDLEFNYPTIPTPAGPVDLNCLEVGLCEFSIALMVLVIYSLGLWVAGLLAFIMLVYTGFTYIMSGASPGMRTRAKAMFQNVLWGLAILLLSNALLVTLNQSILQLETSELFAINATEPIYNETSLRFEGLPNFTGSSCYDSCLANCTSENQDPAICDQQCQNQCSGSGGNPIPTPSSCEETVNSGTDESYNPEGSTKAQIQDKVYKQLIQELTAGGLEPGLIQEYADRFFAVIIPAESSWVPHAENPAGTNCMPVGLYQLEDNRFQKQQCKNEFHRWHHWECATPHAIERFFLIRGTVKNGLTCSGFEYWAPAKRAGYTTC